ncbi:MAG: ferritin-like domain-containing protein [Actinobacteria bacterium]|nr:ferritin-like domain-containing protein [Actinomycetota bacterium]
MSETLTWGELDKDGAVQEAVAKVAGNSRADFLRKAAVGGGTVLGGSALLGALPSLAFGQAPPASDIAILNFALTLEYLEAAFYTEAVARGKFAGKPGRFARVVGAHERTHVAFLKKALGSNAVAKPTFDFKNTTTNVGAFVSTAIVLEDTGVSAYLGQAGNIKTKAILAAAASIVTVEARHAAWIREIRGNSSQPSPAPRAFDAGRTKAQVLAAVTGTGFIVG